MNIHRILIAALVSAALLQISAPADASEVVKLARLVLTGKRTVTDTPREPTTNGGGGAEKTTQAPTTGEASGSSTPELGSSSSSSGSLTGGHGSHIFLRAF